MNRILPLSLLLLLSLLAGCSREEAPPKPVVAVKVARAERATVRLSVHAPATLFPRQQANVAARIIAAIRSLKVRKGDNVAPGQVLAELQNHDLLAQRKEAEAALTEAQATMATDVERARGQVATTEAALSQAQKIYERRRELFEQGAIPARDLLVSQTEYNQAKTAYEVAKKSLELLESQVQGKLPGIAQSRLEQAKARLANVEAQLAFTELRSPFAGTITEQFMYPGDMAKPDAPVFTVMDLAVVVARAQVPEAEAGPVRLGQACSFLPADSPASAEGRVSVVNKAVDPARRTVEVWCQIPNAKFPLRGGVFGALSIFTGSAPDSVVVPKAAVQLTKGTRTGWVMVVDDKNTAHKKDVEIGQVLDGRVQVLKGLNGGEQVIIEGGYALPDGAEVRLAGEKVEEKKAEAAKK